MELCLGTVQFGLDYGIKGQKKPNIDDAVAWMDYAIQNGIRAIDTARAYGEAEKVVGAFLKCRIIPREELFISTKFKPNMLDDHEQSDYAGIITEELQEQLETLHTDYVDAYLFHSSRYAFDEDKIEALTEVKEKGLSRKIGVSVYEPEEAIACFRNEKVDFIQLPYSIFDHRMKDAGVLGHPEKGACEIHSRSAFIQGLITMKEEEVPPYLEKAKPILRKIAGICEREHINRVALAMQYVKREKGISHLVFGVDSLEQLKEDIEFFNSDIDQGLLESIGKEFDGIEADIVMPSLWKK